MPSTEDRFDSTQRSQLIYLARASIQEGLSYGHSIKVDIASYDTLLQQPGAAFVTLHQGDQLRGCIGSLEPYRPLVVDVAENAFAAAFRDPRFPPLTAEEFPELHVHLSVLSPAEPISFTDEQDLLQQIRPGVDGLVLEDKGHRGTFLPSVWESLPQREDFWRHLKAKAGLPYNYWSDTLKVSRYTTESF